MSSARRGGVSGFVRRHWPLLILLAVLAFHGTKSFGVFLAGDDLGWVGRTVADAGRPWNAFVEPLFGSYFRPMPHLVWLANYYVWGLDFAGHQLTLVLMWLAGVCVLYAVGCRIGGRVCGTVAAAALGLNDIWLMVVSWKSWFTTLTEFVLVLGWACVYVKWTGSRRRRDLIAWIVLGVLAMLSRELAPLIISAGVLVTAVLPLLRSSEGPRGRRRARAWLGIWAGATVLVLMALPSYRGALTAIFSSGEAASAVGSGGEPRAVWAGYFVGHFRKHTRSIFSYGILRYLLLFAILLSLARKHWVQEQLGRRYRTVFLGACLIGLVLIGIPWGAESMGERAAQVSRKYIDPLSAAGLLGLFVFAAWRGDRWDRLLGAWFVVSFVPILFLQHFSFAYHLLALAALVLYMGRWVALFVEDELGPILVRFRGRSRGGHDDETRLVTGAIFVILILAQAVRLNANFWAMGRKVAERRRTGRRYAEAVQGAVAGALKGAGPARRVWVGGESYGWLAGLILQEQHGFKMARLDRAAEALVGLRTFDSPFRIYTDVIGYDRAMFERYNALPDGGFESEAAGLARAKKPRTGAFSAMARGGGPSPAFGPFGLRSGSAFVFGGFLRREAERTGRVRMELRSVQGTDYVRRTRPITQRGPQWELVWECAAPPAGSERFMLLAARAERLEQGAVYADDLFLCPVAPLMAVAREGGPEVRARDKAWGTGD